MATKYERFAPLKDAPSDSEVTRIHGLLTANTGFFIDKELQILLTRDEVSAILEIPLERNSDESSILGDLIRREQIREWTGLPEEHKGRKGISLLSVLEFMVKKEDGILEESGRLPSGESPFAKNQAFLQKDVLRRILVQVPDWKKRETEFSTK